MPPKPARRVFQYLSAPRKPSPSPLLAAPAGGEPLASDAEADAVYRIVTAAPTLSTMESALSASAISLSVPLLDLVLRRFRFAHGDPLRALSLLSLAADRCGIAPSPFALDTGLYVLGHARRFSHMSDLLHSYQRLCPDAITPADRHGRPRPRRQDLLRPRDRCVLPPPLTAFPQPRGNGSSRPLQRAAPYALPGEEHVGRAQRLPRAQVRVPGEPPDVQPPALRVEVGGGRGSVLRRDAGART